MAVLIMMQVRGQLAPGAVSGQSSVLSGFRKTRSTAARVRASLFGIRCGGRSPLRLSPVGS
ncbi:hypothetical protein GCM10010271_43780 [Streptomyces kurssanovii]|nr:hypothetical protein GCM10010271_43780 [Streptomyces kurssanovii]